MDGSILDDRIIDERIVPPLVGDPVELALDRAVARADRPGGPPLLAAAMRHAVFPGGARVRPRLSLAVAQACGGDQPTLAIAAASAIELLHCASLVHDDLPCFDDAGLRRGLPSVHAAFGVPLALLAGDALIVLGFEVLAEAGSTAPTRLPALLGLVARSVGAPHGIAAGQAWECESNPVPADYRCAKTGALFVAATMAGALASGADPEPWRLLGHRLGEAYQVADDLLDATATGVEQGKPTGRDAALGRPNAVAELGVERAVERLETLIAGAMASIPPSPGAAALRDLVRAQALRLAPKQLLHGA
ncbi:polyprenyl synthetase family protein [Zavarzinia sp. CC-PAN008]|uniref:polyprenyl synthetase family protein n=1 Tax=Zavarzinia sp. CC-PAN008 TaxID=3243332 RepID=UPI003F747B94